MFAVYSNNCNGDTGLDTPTPRTDRGHSRLLHQSHRNNNSPAISKNASASNSFPLPAFQQTAAALPSQRYEGSWLVPSLASGDGESVAHKGQDPRSRLRLRHHPLPHKHFKAWAALFRWTAYVHAVPRIHGAAENQLFLRS